MINLWLMKAAHLIEIRTPMNFSAEKNHGSSQPGLLTQANFLSPGFFPSYFCPGFRERCLLEKIKPVERASRLFMFYH
jgi:hypothetical protein